MKKNKIGKRFKGTERKGREGVIEGMIRKAFLKEVTFEQRLNEVKEQAMNSEGKVHFRSREQRVPQC